MATMQKERLRPLTVAERRALETTVKASSERVDRVKRATALLAVAAGQPFAAATEAAGYRSPQAVTYLVRRFNRLGLAALEIAAGRGRRPTYDTAARGRIVATAARGRALQTQTDLPVFRQRNCTRCPSSGVNLKFLAAWCTMNAR